jgi:hypothetical protein
MRRNARTLLFVVIVLMMLLGGRAVASVDAEVNSTHSLAPSEILLAQRSTTNVPKTNPPQPTQASQSTPLPSGRPKDDQLTPGAGTGTPTPDWTGTAAAIQTADAAESQTAAANAAAQTAAVQVRATLYAAQTQVVEGTQVAGTAVVGAEHTIAAENQATYAARTAAASTDVSEVPTSLPTASQTAAPTPSPTPAAIAVAPTDDQIDILGLSFDRLTLGLGLIGAGVVVALLLIVAGSLYMAQRRARPRLPVISPRDQVPSLVSVEPPGRVFALAQSPATIGRDKKLTVTIDNSFPHVETVSRQHARIERHGDRYVLVDGVKLGQASANGVFVNGRRTSQNFLKDGDRIGFGLVEFVLSLGTKE